MFDETTVRAILDLYNRRMLSHVPEKFILNEIFEKYFMRRLGYNYENFRVIASANQEEYCIQNIENPEQKIGLLICKDEISLKEEAVLLQILEDNEAEWGYITNGADIILMNQYIKTSKIEKWKTRKRVLEVRIGKKADMDYLTYFTRKELFVDKNALYFKDIAEYKNVQYRGSEESWAAYNSSLKRFFKYYLMQYGGKYNGYEKFTFANFEGFIRKQKVRSPYTIENMYAHISVYLRDKIGMRLNGFEMSRKDVLKVFTEVKKEELGNILDVRRISKINEFFCRKQTYQIRNMTIFYLSIFYGIERRQICQLKWSDINFETSTITLDGIDKPMPKQLIQLLHELEIEHEQKGYPKEYVFYVRRNNKCYPITRDTINKMFSSLMEIDPDDEVYTQYSPAKIRKTLASICIKKVSLEEVMLWFSIDAENLSRYLSTEEILDAGREKLAARKKEGKKCHPMEEVLDRVFIGFYEKSRI